VLDKVELEQDFSKHFGLLHTHHYPSSGDGSVGQILIEVQSKLKSHAIPRNPHPPEILKNLYGPLTAKYLNLVRI
jgi:hypothetical protein